MFINNFDPVAFQVFSFEIRWYSLSYIFGIIFGWIYCNKILIKDPKIKDLFSDYIGYLIIGIVVGGRLGSVFIYNFNYYFNNPLENRNDMEWWNVFPWRINWIYNCNNIFF